MALCAQRLNSGGGLVKNGLLDTDLVRTKGKRTLAKAVLMHSRKRKSAGSMPGIHLRYYHLFIIFIGGAAGAERAGGLPLGEPV